jgi:hypothetical protein
MLYATVREDSKNDGTEAHVMPLTSTASLPADMTISDSDYPIQVLHQDDDGLVYMLLNNEVVVGDSIDFDFMHDECEGSNLNEDKTLCWDCEGQP